MLLPTIPLCAATNQAYNMVIVWAETHMDRAMFGLTLPVTWLLTLDGLMTIVGICITIPLWRWLAARRCEPDTVHKFAIAGVLVAAAYGVLAAGTVLAPLAPAAVVVLFFVLFDFSFGWVDPPTNAFVSRFAPASVVTTVMSISLMINAGIPNIVVGWIGRFYEPLGPAVFWALHAALAAASGMLALVLRPAIKRLLDGHSEEAI